MDAQDEQALAKLAAQRLPDPWLVVDALLARGKVAVAEAFAGATPRDDKDVEALPGYVTARREGPEETAAREALAAVQAALDRRDAAGILAATTSWTPGPGTVVGARLLEHRAPALFVLGRRDESLAAVREASQAAQAIGWLRQAAGAPGTLGFYAYRRSDLELALAAYEMSLTVQAKRADRRDAALLLHNIGDVHAGLGAYDEALACYERALAEREALGDEGDLAATLIDLAHLHGYLGHEERAVGYYTRGLALARAAGNRAWEANALEGLGNVHDRRGELEGALARFEASLAIRRELGDELHVASSLRNLGNVHGALGDAARAIALYEEALRLRGRCGDRRGQAQTL